MPFIEVTEPYAVPPRLRALTPQPLDTMSMDVDHGYLDLRDAAIVGDGLPVDAQEFDLAGCSFEGVDFPAGSTLEARNCRFEQCDLSQVRVRRLDNVQFDGCKLVGTDLSDARIDDVEFDQCLLRYVNIRMARLQRVAFAACSLDDVDCYEATITDATFVGSTLDQVTCSGVKWQAVDLRGAKALGLAQIGSLEGVLISDPQVIELAYVLALRSGADIEADD